MVWHFGHLIGRLVGASMAGAPRGRLVGPSVCLCWQMSGVPTPLTWLTLTHVAMSFAQEKYLKDLTPNMQIKVAEAMSAETAPAAESPAPAPAAPSAPVVEEEVQRHVEELGKVGGDGWLRRLRSTGAPTLKQLPLTHVFEWRCHGMAATGQEFSHGSGVILTFLQCNVDS